MSARGVRGRIDRWARTRVFDVLLAVVVPAEEFEVVEVRIIGPSRAAAFPKRLHANIPSGDCAASLRPRRYAT
jgi:hypothetical protein